jgi:hypothetical protein
VLLCVILSGGDKLLTSVCIRMFEREESDVDVHQVSVFRCSEKGNKFVWWFVYSTLKLV